ncbi:MAG TPA: carboxylating nicotinate-nucleotide diphosphorylase [Acidimicrobiales bacterium]|nr:carboxylating nicotinate-nucleotide diphosphorylase [Acidimicrobiales bacterium]
MNAAIGTSLRSAGLDPDEVSRIVDTALDEDLRYGPDVTTEATIRADQIATAQVVARESGIVCGVDVARAVLDVVGFAPEGVTVHVHDGEPVEPGTVILTASGLLRPLLVAERTVLNFLTHLSGVSTVTRTWVGVLEGTGCRVRDTRKTLPGLRQLEKYAVRCGGGVNHRMGLGDAALIKDNHVAASGSIARAIADVRRSRPDIALEAECDRLDQVREALDAGCSLILLDNMVVSDIEKAVELASSSDALLEASGGITLDNVRAIAQTGVDYVAVGAITHSVRALDLGLDIREDEPT